MLLLPQEWGCWNANNSVRDTALFMRKAMAFMDADPLVLRCANLGNCLSVGLRLVVCAIQLYDAPQTACKSLTLSGYWLVLCCSMYYMLSTELAGTPLTGWELCQAASIRLRHAHVSRFSVAS